ncbi:MAG: carbon-nitrogen hydrolase family protein [Candidatus Hadarchaeales archaeon]
MGLRLALVQFARGERREENLRRMLDLLSTISGADLVCLPENWVGREVLEEGEWREVLGELGEIAREGRFSLLTGGAYLRRGGRILSSCYALEERGRVVGRSDKLFPSQSTGERSFLSRGREFGPFTLGGVKLGVVVCVDALYPEPCRALSARGAQLLLNPSNIPENRVGTWRQVGVTRAVENGVFFAFVNNTHSTYPDGRKVVGHSFLVSPTGEVLAEAGEEETILEGEVNLSVLREVRSRWPFLRDTGRFWRRTGFSPSWRGG